MKNPKYLHYVPKRIGIFGLCILASCSTKTETLFTPLPVGAAGIGFQNTLTEGGPINILDYLYFYNGGGTAMGDINNDGLSDLFFSANQKPNGLYLNKGNLTFENITKKAGVQGNSSWNTA
ncbi:MAG: FG-GAP repeat domain-containing protein, partial [Marinirhabdus sp.]